MSTAEIATRQEVGLSRAEEDRPTMEPLTTSERIDQIAAALAKAQGAIEGAKKDKTNPHFRSSYADLASAWDACREALSKNAIAVIQVPSGKGGEVRLTTLLAHASGQWIGGTSSMTAQQNTPQGIGSCQTYLRRYSLMAMVGIAPEDDDGNAASNRPKNGGPRTMEQKRDAAPSANDTGEPATDEQKDEIRAGVKRLKWDRKQWGVWLKSVTTTNGDDGCTSSDELTAGQATNVLMLIEGELFKAAQ